MKKTTGFVFGTLLFIIIGVLFWFFIGGGFDSIEVKKHDRFVLRYYGRSFEGSLKSKEIGELYKMIDSKLEGRKMIVYYEGVPNKENGYWVKAFIGGENNFKGSVVKEIDLGKVYSARHDANNLLNKAQTSIFNQAKEDEEMLKLDKMVEIYYTKNDLEVFIPIIHKKK